jgi:hypothetical protein
VAAFAGGSHGVRFKPPSQSVSCRHQVRDRRQTRPGRSGTSVQPVSRVSRWHVLSVASSTRQAQQAQTGTGRTTRQTFALTRPLNLGSANDRAEGGRRTVFKATRLGQWPSPDAKAPASGRPGLKGDRSIAFLTCVASRQYNARRDSRFQGRLFTAQNEIIPMDHLGTARVTQDQQNIA